MSALLFRIYHKTPKHAHHLLGTVIAADATLALEKAKRGEWHKVIAELERESSKADWVALV